MHVINVMVVKMTNIVFTIETVMHVKDVMATVMEVMDIGIGSKLYYM